MSAAPQALELAPGLWRWTAAHPEWRPGAEPGSPDDWDEIVGCVLHETPEAVVLIDPLLPREHTERFLAWLDGIVAARRVSILTTVRWHRRDREALAGRYGSNSEMEWNAVPPGVVPRPIRGAGETIYWLPAVAALVPGDTLLGNADGRVELCPESWLEDVRVDRAGLAHLLRPLLELPVERVLVSHGAPVLHDGRAELAHALARAGAEGI